ncbi:hypothetical protein T492DRAFT_878012 [Pavlovales sp. CCMP2436]|nr:hypothetical protein T492DRAFT_878012 [Pavlovales sp. CCMP2436]
MRNAGEYPQIWPTLEGQYWNSKGGADGGVAAGSWLPLANTRSSAWQPAGYGLLARRYEPPRQQTVAYSGSEEWELIGTSANEARLVRRAFSTGVRSTPLNTGVDDKGQAAASEQGQQGGAWPTSELECSHDGCLHARNDEPLLPRTDDGYQQAGLGYWSGVQAPDSEEEGMSGLKRWKTSDCDEPDCAYKCSGPEMLRGHKRSKHGAEMLCCGHPGCEFETAWLTSLRNHRDRHRIAPQSPPPAALQAGAPVEPHPDAESAVRKLLGEMNAEEVAAPATQPARLAVREEHTASLRAKLAAALEHEARMGALVSIIEQRTDLLRAALDKAEQDKTAAVVKLEAMRQSAAAAVQAAVELHGCELRAAVAEAEGKTAAAVADAQETTRQSTFAAGQVMADAYERSLLSAEAHMAAALARAAAQVAEACADAAQARADAEQAHTNAGGLLR